MAYTDGLKTNSSDGWKTDAYGSFIHTSTKTSNYWCIKSNTESVVFKVWYESGNLDASGVITEGGTLLSDKYAAKSHTHDSITGSGATLVASLSATPLLLAKKGSYNSWALERKSDSTK